MGGDVTASYSVIDHWFHVEIISEEKKMKNWTLALALVAVLTFVVACAAPAATPTVSSAQSATAKPTVAPATSAPKVEVGGTLIEASFSDIRTFNSILSSDTSSSDFWGWMVGGRDSGLVRIRRDLKPECYLCESYAVSPDNLKITFKLRKDVKFWDGKPLTADDVKFTYEAIFEKENASPRRSQMETAFGTIDNIKVVDPYTVEFNYPKVKADTLVSDFIYGILPKHILAGKKGKDFIEHEFNTTKPLYYGPFKYKEGKKGDRYVLEANPDFFLGKPKLGQYVYKIVPDSAAVFAGLKAQEIDLAQILPEQAIEARKLDYLNVVGYDQFNFTFFAFNLDPKKTELFLDKRVRQALLYAIDRKAIVDSQLFGYGSVANSVMPPISWAYNKDTKPVYNYDSKKAEALLDEAGWKKGADGIRAKDGKKLSFTLWTNSGNKVRESSIVAIQSNWKDIGVDVKTATEEWNAYLKRIGATADGTRDYEVMLIGFNWNVDPSQKAMWHTTSFAPTGFNLNWYKNEQLDKIMDDALATLDETKRKELYFKMQDILADEVPSPIIFFSQRIQSYTKRLSGYTPSVAGSFNNFHEWSIAPLK